MLEFSEGEWRFVSAENENQFIICTNCMPVPETENAYMGTPVGSAIGKANATLMAAAPDMYAMLKSVLREAKNGETGFVRDVEELLREIDGEEFDDSDYVH